MEPFTPKTTRWSDDRMFSLFKKDPTRKLQKEYEKKTQAAFQAQQNGNVRQYSLLTAEAEKIREQIDALKENE